MPILLLNTDQQFPSIYTRLLLTRIYAHYPTNQELADEVLKFNVKQSIDDDCKRILKTLDNIEVIDPPLFKLDTAIYVCIKEIYELGYYWFSLYQV